MLIIGNLDNGKSTGGYVVKIGSGVISWSSKLQALVALSTTEAEHISAVEVGKEILWMCQFMGELGYSITGPSLLRMDNQSAIAVLDKQSVIVDMSVKPTPCTQGHIAQWLEHLVYNWEVLGSNPSLVIFLCRPTLYPLGHFPFGPCFPIGPFPHWAVEVPQIQHAVSKNPEHHSKIKHLSL